MAHFAEIDENNIVLRVLVTDNDFPNEGYDWLVENLGGTWIQTSYNRNFRGNFAQEGYTYDSEADIFLPPQPYPSWVLDETGLIWIAPKRAPADDKLYEWDEASQNWNEV